MKFSIISVFPRMFDSYLSESILKRAQEKKLIKIETIDLRSFTKDKHRKVDDRPYGGGAGMVMKIDPIYRAVKYIESRIKNQESRKKSRIILFSTRGKRLDQKMARRLAKYKHIILICGRYEGVDERVADYVADEEISIGNYILSGGELPAMVLIDSVSRQIRGVLGKHESLEEIKGSYPVYTRPPVFTSGGKKMRVPDVLLSGDHKKIEEWRKNYNKN